MRMGPERSYASQHKTGLLNIDGLVPHPGYSSASQEALTQPAAFATRLVGSVMIAACVPSASLLFLPVSRGLPFPERHLGLNWPWLSRCHSYEICLP